MISDYFKETTFPHHKHLPEGMKESKEKGINEVLKEIEMLVVGLR